MYSRYFLSSSVFTLVCLKMCCFHRWSLTVIYLEILCYRCIPDAVDFPQYSWQHFSLRCYLHRQRSKKNWKSISRFLSNSWSFCCCFGHDFCHSQWSTWLLDIWHSVLRHVDRFWRHVLNSFYTKLMRYIFRPIYTHQGSFKVSVENYS